MQKKGIKNYIILILLILCTIIVTFVLSNIYKNKDKKVNPFYEYANKITIDEFDQYMLENSDVIIYISDKYSLQYEQFEKKFKSKIIESNLNEKIIFIDKKDINKKFISKLQKQYNISINLNKIPIILIIVDKELQKQIYVNADTNVENFIDYEDFQ